MQGKTNRHKIVLKTNAEGGKGLMGQEECIRKHDLCSYFSFLLEETLTKVCGFKFT